MRIILNISEKTAEEKMRFVARAIRYARIEMVGNLEGLRFRDSPDEDPTYFSLYRNKNSITIREDSIIEA